MGIPIYCNRGKGGGVYIDDKYKFTTSFFTQFDIQSIILGLTIYDSFAKIPRKKSVLNKLYLLAPDLVSFLERNIDDYFIADIFDEKIDVQNKVCKDINFCMEVEKLIEITLENDVKKIVPISYVLKKDGLHIYCFDGQYHLIKIKDIKSSKIINEKYIRDFIPYKKI